ncbi:hypothetical protein V6N12_003216 [Hibiscus sabdariffa]|uniref:Uncharacterized protein n=1 Tax=Hibiscus sabdariffa TaxID=183260 RepID=A0ABR2EET3_9ROSI
MVPSRWLTRKCHVQGRVHGTSGPRRLALMVQVQRCNGPGAGCRGFTRMGQLSLLRKYLFQLVSSEPPEHATAFSSASTRSHPNMPRHSHISFTCASTQITTFPII